MTTTKTIHHPYAEVWDGRWGWLRWQFFRGTMLRDAQLTLRLPLRRACPRLEISLHWIKPSAEAEVPGGQQS